MTNPPMTERLAKALEGLNQHWMEHGSASAMAVEVLAAYREAREAPRWPDAQGRYPQGHPDVPADYIQCSYEDGVFWAPLEEPAPPEEQGEAPKNKYEPWKQTEIEYTDQMRAHHQRNPPPETPLTLQQLVRVLRGMCRRTGNDWFYQELADALEAAEKEG